VTVPGPVDILRHADAASLAEAAAGRIVTTITMAQMSNQVPSLCLTGGGIGTGVLRALAQSPARSSLDWSRVEFWWGDERFVPTGSPERNETGARESLLNVVAVDPGRVHPFPAPEDCGDNPEESAARYAETLSAWGGDEPSLDIVLLGIGPDAHVASLFPELPALHDTRLACAVHGSPKPPPVRVTLTMRTIQLAREVWILASGAEKAEAVALALTPGAGAFQVPAAGARGRERTLFLIDEAAASRLPADLGRPSA
jgi:6-phosphogluconolactonase